MALELAVALLCSQGHREATLKSYWSPVGAASLCGHCGLTLRVVREAQVRVRSIKPRPYTRTERTRLPNLCTICEEPLRDHRPYWRHPT